MTTRSSFSLRYLSSSRPSARSLARLRSSDERTASAPSAALRTALFCSARLTTSVRATMPFSSFTSTLTLSELAASTIRQPAHLCQTSGLSESRSCMTSASMPFSLMTRFLTPSWAERFQTAAAAAETTASERWASRISVLCSSVISGVTAPSLTMRSRSSAAVRQFFRRTQKARVSSSVLLSRCGTRARTPPSLTIESLAAMLPEERLMRALATARRRTSSSERRSSMSGSSTCSASSFSRFISIWDMSAIWVQMATSSSVPVSSKGRCSMSARKGIYLGGCSSSSVRWM
mmetsp:Transcript_30384/g.83261  ORF Transcript_30384/g.83261 Transcript_30384/m.83261 type:complete len:291 (-) Transcript_30384:1557-2429(-)